MEIEQTVETREFCGLFGVFGDDDAAEKTLVGLQLLQHRGQESAGIASSNGRDLVFHKGMGLVQEVFQPALIETLRNPMAIGHVRYSTTGSSKVINAQPFVVEFAKGPLAIGHNGNLVNAKQMRDAFEAHGSIFQTTMDTEIIVHLIARPGPENIRDAIVSAMKDVRGAFSLVILTPGMLVGVRDPHGFRPLWIGRTPRGAWLLSSETAPFHHAFVGAEPIREVEPGEVVFIDSKGIESRRICPPEQTTPHYCIFEHVYLARPDSRIFGDEVYLVRKALGRQLAREHPVEADIVVPVPDTGTVAALGFSQESGIPLEMGFLRSHYARRTFIQPEAGGRSKAVETKLAAVESIVRGKRLVMVDDSIIRGTTSLPKIRSLRRAGAKEIHLRISCPPTRFPCFYGIDFQTSGELLAQSHSIPDIAKRLEVDSLGYLSLEGMCSCVSNPCHFYCTACWTGRYPERIPDDQGKFSFERNGCDS